MSALKGPLGSTMSGHPFRSFGLAFGLVCIAASPLAHSQVSIHVTTAAPQTTCIMTTDANGLSLIPGGTDLQATGVTFSPPGCGQGGLAPPSPDNFPLVGVPATGTVPLVFTVTWSVTNAATCTGYATLDGTAATIPGWTDSNSASPEARTLTITQPGSYVLTMTCSNAASPPASVTSQPANLTAQANTTGCVGPAGLTQLTTSNISYGVNANPVRANVDVTEWNNIWGHASTTDGITPWPGVDGAGPVIRQMGRTTFVAAHFNTGSSPMYAGTLTDQSNIGGPDIDVVMSTTCGDFSPNAVFPGCSRFSMPSDGITHFQYFSFGGNAGTQWCSLSLNTDYYLNIKFHDPTSPVECSPGNPVCPLFTIDYWAPYVP